MFKIPITIWCIGGVTLLINLSSCMIYSLSPLYLTQVFGLAAYQLGILEGLVEFTAWFVRIFSGLISDYMRKRKPLLIIAYSLIFITRPIFALAPSIGWIYFAKMTDRIANGLQATPREALVGDIAPKELKGACFGLRQSLGVIGSLLGAISVMYLMHVSENDYPFIFWIASIPALLGLFSILFFVNDPVQSELRNNEKTSFISQLKQVANLNSSFWTVIATTFIYMTSNYSGAYRILLAEKRGFEAANVALVMIIQNLAVMFAAYPIGRLSDNYDRRLLLGLGFLFTIGANFVFYSIDNMPGVLIGSALWGIQMGITQSLFLSLVADTAQKELRGSAFGVYYLVNAFALFFANSLTGWIFEMQGIDQAFLISSAIAATSLILLPTIRIENKDIRVLS